MVATHGPRRRAKWLLLLAPLFALITQVAAASEPSVFGYWKAVDKDTGRIQSIFRLWEDKGKLVGKILKVFPKKDGSIQKVCDECSGAQKGAPVEGLLFLWGFTRDPENPHKWIDGRVLNPENGKTYNCEATLADNGETLTIYGYIRLIVKIGGSSVWQRPTAAELQSLSQH